MPLTQQAIDYFAHSTSAENLRKMLGTGKLMPLQRLADANPDMEVSVEPNRWNRERQQMRLADAIKQMQGKKQVDKVFLSRNGTVPSYGNYVILKQLKSPKPHTALNLIPEEYTTGRTLSLRNKASIYVPDEELAVWRQQHRGIKFHPKSQIPVQDHSHTAGVKSLLGKIKSRTEQTFRFGKAANELPLTGAGIKRHLSRNAMFVGSRELGINVDNSDTDIFIPYNTQAAFERAKSRIGAKMPGLLESKANGGRTDKYTISGKVKSQDVDIVLAHGERAKRFQDAFNTARVKLTPGQQAQIVTKKKALKDSWLLPEWRYKQYKKQLAQDLGLSQAYF
jgi:hypothetical protein